MAKQKKAGPKFTATPEEHDLVMKIAWRASNAAAAFKISYDVLSAEMDISAVHASGCPLRLADLLAANDGDFGHDTMGIRRFIDRNTGRLAGCFFPRFAVKKDVIKVRAGGRLVGYKDAG